MLPGPCRAEAPRIIHQHTHVHHHVHCTKHVHHKAARFFTADKTSAALRGRSGNPAANRAPRVPRRSRSPATPRTRLQKARQFFRKYVVPVLGWLLDALVFCATRISFGFGFRVGHLPFFGDNVD